MSFVYGIDPDSHLLGGWQLDPIKLKITITVGRNPATAASPSMAADNRTSAARTHATSSALGLPIQVVEKEKLLDDLEQTTPKGHPAADKWTVTELVAITVFAVLSLLAFAGLYYSGPG